VSIGPSHTYFDRQPMLDLKSLIARYPKGEFESPFRSTVPLLSLLRDGHTVLQDVLTGCGFPQTPDLHFEFTVPPPLGDGTPSHTDLMAIGGSLCMAIEAKWTEPLSESVKDWLGPQPTKNRQEVLAGWLSLIKRYATQPVTAADVMLVSYQILHRAASACATAEQPQLSYLQFVSRQHGNAAICQDRVDDLNRLRSVLGASDRFPFRLVEIGIEPTSAFELLAPLPKGSTQTALAVQKALDSKVLFAFQIKQIHLLS
jgi:hypothetical protein